MLNKSVREIIERDSVTKCASIFDPLSARMACEIGFEVGILGGSVASLQALGAPDVFLLTLNELVSQTRKICRVSELPMIVDGDSGYGSVLNVMRTIEELEHAGASLITLEDTIIPKPRGTTQAALYPIDEACAKLKAALDARKNTETAIFARTHADQPTEEMVKRIKAYAHTGVDGICLFGCTNRDRLATWANECDLPIMLISYGEPDLGTDDELANLNVKIRFSGHSGFEDAVRATYLSLQQQFSQGMLGSNESGKELIARFSEQGRFKQLEAKY